jgi:deoxyribodipyrimidine photo-lyase
MAATRSCKVLHCAFVFDTDILDALPHYDRRVEFIRESVAELNTAIGAAAPKTNTGLICLHGVAADEITNLAKELKVNAVFAGRDYEPAAIQRDALVAQQLGAIGIALVTVKDHVIFEQRELLTQTGKPYTVFTPYLRNWLQRLTQEPLSAESQPNLAAVLAPMPASAPANVPTLQGLGFEATNLRQLKIVPGTSGATALVESFWDRLSDYDRTRDFPSVKGPSYLGVHLRFGTVSIRQLVRLALPLHLQGDKGASVWLSELAWRDFYFQILANFPHVASQSFKPAYDAIQWETGPEAYVLFDCWCKGETGYPLVDAAMAQLNQTGYMHNRLRMVAGSFLVKHLGIDWRRGERYFAEKLNDFDLSANNGGWQWVSSSGCDAQPYFRIFNPITQSEKFDAQGKFIKRYLPQLAKLDSRHVHAPWLAKPEVLRNAAVVLGENYALPIVDHASARARTLQRYAVVKAPDHTSTDGAQ